MSPLLSRRVRSIAPSATSRAATAPLGTTAHEPVIDLAAGCPDWAPPPGVVEAARRSLDASVAYGRPGGEPELLTAIVSGHLGRDAVDGASVVATCGGKEALYLALGAAVDPGDTVVLCAPCWPTFVDQVRAFGGVVRMVSATADGQPSLEALRNACEGAKVIVVNTPGNPSGISWSRQAAQIVVDSARRRDSLIVVDSVYGQLAYGPTPTTAEWLYTESPERTLIVDGASKRLAVPGLRLGWALGPAFWIDGARRLQDASTTHPSLPAQAAGLAGLRVEAEWLPGVRSRLANRADALVQAIASAPELSVHPPTAGLFALVRLPEGIDDAELTRRLGRQRALKCVPGSVFGAPGTLRLALRVSGADIRAAVRRICDELALMRCDRPTRRI